MCLLAHPKGFALQVFPASYISAYEVVSQDIYPENGVWLGQGAVLTTWMLAWRCRLRLEALRAAGVVDYAGFLRRKMRTRTMIGLAILSVLIWMTVCADASFAQAPAPGVRPRETAPATQSPAPMQETTKPASPAKNDYSKAENWLCRPGRQDACAVDLTTTVISASGELTRENFSPDANAPIDCFYVYPTVSNDPGGNSDMVPGPEEKAVIRAQFARFASKCRPYAPMYRQVTLSALRAALSGSPIPTDRALAYDDVLDAWNYYLEHDNHKRGVVLIGHSQGANILGVLVKQEIDGKPVQSRIVSVMLLGSNVPVPKGKDVGGAFQHVPLCREAAQTGCVIAYVTFRASSPPPANTLFGRVPGENMVAACTNPASLSGGSGELHAYLGTHGSFVNGAEADVPAWVKSGQAIDTSFVSVPGMLTAECSSNENGSFLAVSIHADANGARASDIPGDIVVSGQPLPELGIAFDRCASGYGQSAGYRRAAIEKLSFLREKVICRHASPETPDSKKGGFCVD